MRILAALLLATTTACIQVTIRRDPASQPPSSFVRSTSETRSTQLIDLRDGLTKATAFRLATEALAEHATVDVSDAHAGFLMTSWQSTFMRAGIPDLRYRTRLIVRFMGDDWRRVSVRAEANWQHGDEWDVGYDQALLDEAAAALATQLGRR